MTDENTTTFELTEDELAVLHAGMMVLSTFRPDFPSNGSEGVRREALDMLDDVPDGVAERLGLRVAAELYGGDVVGRLFKKAIDFAFRFGPDNARDLMDIEATVEDEHAS